MNNNQQQLKALKAKHSLSYADIQAICGVSFYTVKSWMLHEGSQASRTISNDDLEKIKQFKGD